MSRKLQIGYESVGHIEGLNDELTPAYLKLDQRGATVTVPQVGAMGDLWAEFHEDSDSSVPANLRYVDTSGIFVLDDCGPDGGSVSTLGTGFLRIRARRVVQAGQEAADYSEVDGMTSEIDGWAGWTGMSTVDLSVQYSPPVLTLHAENRESISVGGRVNASVESSFWFNPRPTGNLFQVEDVALLRTRSDELWPWADHAAVHRMFQDLMCLVFGRPCLAKLASVKREDDQPWLKPDDPRRTWREVHEPTFGRSVEGIERLDRSSARPLFKLSDVNRAALATWIDEWHLWSRPTWIAVTTMFQRGTTAEAHLLQIGVALEALGYALWMETGPAPAAKAPLYPRLLERVTDAVAVAHPAMYGDAGVVDWRELFNKGFKGIKHADNPLTDGHEAHLLARQGMNLIRAWLATRLGVSDDVLLAGLDRIR